MDWDDGCVEIKWGISNLERASIIIWNVWNLQLIYDAIHKYLYHAVPYSGKVGENLLFGSSSLSRKLCEFQCQETNPPIALHVKYGA